MRTSRTETALSYPLLCFFAVLALTPLVQVLVSALIPAGEAGADFTIPSRLAFSNFRAAWVEGHFSAYMAHSVIVTVGVVALSTVLSAPSVLSGYAFATMQFPGRTVLFYVMLLGLMLPEEVFVIPLYFDLRGWGLTDTYWALRLPQTAQSLAFGTFFHDDAGQPAHRPPWVWRSSRASTPPRRPCSRRPRRSWRCRSCCCTCSCSGGSSPACSRGL